MNNQIQNFLNYLLDTETTSEIAFIDNIQKKNELFQSRHLKDWELTVFSKLSQLHRNTILSPLNHGDNEQKSENESSSDDESSTSESEKEEEVPNQNGHVIIISILKNKILFCFYTRLKLLRK